MNHKLFTLFILLAFLLSGLPHTVLPPERHEASASSVSGAPALSQDQRLFAIPPASHNPASDRPHRPDHPWRLFPQPLAPVPIDAIATHTPEAVILRIAPSTVQATMGSRLELRVEIDAGNQPIDSIAAYLNFDPTILQVERLEAGTTLPLELQNRYDNTAGQIDFAAGALSDFPSGTFTVVVLHLQAVAETTGTLIAFHTQSPRQSNATFRGLSVLTQTQNGIVRVGDFELPTIAPVYLPLVKR